MSERRKNPPHTAKDDLAIERAALELVGYTREDFEEWERQRDEKLIKLKKEGFSLGALAAASGFPKTCLSRYLSRRQPEEAPKNG